MECYQTTCIVCHSSRPNSSGFHHITYERTKEKPDYPSLAERVCKILKMDDIHISQGSPYPLVMCSSCLQEMTQIENAAKVKKKFKKSLKKSLDETLSVAGCRRERKRSGQKSGDKTRKERRLECKLSASDLELCVKEMDELITHILQDELRSKSKASDSGLLSTELAIVKETLCEMEKEIGKYESTKASGSAKHASEGVIRELLMKHRITLEYKDKLVQHLNRMIAYISKHKSNFDCNADGLQKFCRILEVVYRQKSRPNEGGDIGDDSSSISSSLSSMSCSSITTNLKQSVDNIFKQTAAQIAKAWRETSDNIQARTDHPTSTAEPQTVAKEKPLPVTTEDEEMVIGSQMQKIINGQENEEEVIDIESVGSDESNEEEQVGDQTKPGEDDQNEPAEKKKVDDGSGEASSSSSNAMIIDDDEDEEQERLKQADLSSKVKKNLYHHLKYHHLKMIFLKLNRPRKMRLSSSVSIAMMMTTMRKRRRKRLRKVVVITHWNHSMSQQC
ncbi:uncharacterized protein [Amphiura filiformis]|uniref:uncharacterized protein n=1 Tax=Amphiura filiformis TaxID=82378 RepID=UPI003B21B3C0